MRTSRIIFSRRREAARLTCAVRTDVTVLHNSSERGLLITAPRAWAKATYTPQMTHYAGFDGDPWPTLDELVLAGMEADLYETGLVPIHYFHEVTTLYKGIDQSLMPRLLYLSPYEDDIIRSVADFRHIGVDVGYFNSGYSLFSCVLNEIASGVPGISGLNCTLNEYSLFNKEDDARAYLAKRLAMVNTGLDLETIGPDENPRVLHIYLYGLTGRLPHDRPDDQGGLSGHVSVHGNYHPSRGE
jgi:hypothetical protein